MRVRKNSPKESKGYEGGQVLIAQQLVYGKEGTIELANGDDVEPISRVMFDNKTNAVVGYGQCGNGSYVAVNKEEAEQLIQFLKDCYQLSP